MLYSFTNNIVERRKMEILNNIIIALITTGLGSILSYLAAVKKAKTEIDSIKIKSEAEIKKIEAEYQKQIEKLKIETDEQIKLKMADVDIKSKSNEEDLKSKYMSDLIGQFMMNPEETYKKMENIQKIAKQFSVTKK
jgi:hypothetical protein